MPCGHTTLAQKPHGEGRGIDDADAAFFKEVQIIHQLVVAQAMVAEVQHRLYRTFGGVLHHPLQVLQLQVGDSDVSHHTFFAQGYQGRQCLVHNLMEVGKLNVVHIDEVDIVHVQALHAFVHALRGPSAAIVPGVHAILSIASHLGRQVIPVAGYLFQRLSQHRFRLVVAVVGRHVDKVDARINGCVHRFDAFLFFQFVKHASQ